MDELKNRVLVTGMGIVSALGIGVERNLDLLILGKTAVGQISYLKTLLNDQLVAAEIPYSNEELHELSGVKHIPGISRAALLGLIAAKEAIYNTNLLNPELRTGLISGTTAEAMTSIELYLRNSILKNDDKNEYIESQDWGHSTEIIASELGIDGFTTTINTACSSAANAIMLGTRMIKNNMLDRVVVGGTDALSKVMLNGFNSLMILDRELCKPFDKNRIGMNLGEGAAFLVLESEKVATEDEIICEISGYGNANDAHHLTALADDGGGAFGAMHQAIKIAGLHPGEIGYLNAHGTGTINNDLSEAIAIEKLFGSNIPMFSSTKPFTGHTLGSSGALEAIFSILAISNNLVFPNLNFSEPMMEANVIPETSLVTAKEISHVMSNSLGFGGNNTSLIFSKY